MPITILLAVTVASVVTQGSFSFSQSVRGLSRFDFVRQYTARFVNPNATCPVCGERVFYFQNEYGSRVFFDELGWPWPKHPCTDNRSNSFPGKPAFAKLMKEFDAPAEPERYSSWEYYSIDRLLAPDFFSSDKFREKYGGRPPRLFEATQVVRMKGRTVIRAQEIGKDRDATFVLKERSQTVQRSDLFSIHDGELSIFNKRGQQTVEKRFERVKGLTHLFEILAAKAPAG
jgi:hypothetical protein